MRSLTVTLETITPLFLSGADPRGQPELRAASFRGALRFWLRALLGGALGDHDLNVLHRSESAVFGSTGTGASPVVVRVSGSLTGQNFEFGKSQALDYLFFSMRGRGGERDRQMLPPGKSFMLTLQHRPGLTATGEAMERACAALWLLTYLGGLGARSRHGGGGLQAKQNPDQWPSNVPALAVAASTPENLQLELADGLRRVRQLVDTPAHVAVGNPSAFDVLHPAVCQVWVVDKDFDTWREALEAIGGTMQRFRTRRQPDYENVKAAVQGETLNQPVQRAAFGLPMVFYYKSLDGQKGTLQGEDHDRRASPLLIRAVRLADGQYTVVLTLFRAELLPHHERLTLKRPGPPAHCDAPDLSLIDDFLANMDTDVAPRREVIYT